MKKSTGVVVSLLLLVVLASSLYFIYGVEQTQITSKTFVNPDWARLECAPTDALEGKSVISSPSDNQVITCGVTENTEDCRLRIRNTGGSILTLGTVNFYLNNLKYTMQKNDPVITLFMDAGDAWKYEYAFAGSSDDVEIIKEWKPWKLYRFVGGSKFVVNSNNCDVSSSLKGSIRDEDYPGSKLYRTGGEGTKWINYVNAWNYGPATNVFKHSQYGEVYCNAAQIFDIIELKMEDGSLVKIDPEYKEKLPDGNVLNGQGSKLANVECCPNEPNCGSNFKYEQTAKSCFTDSQCANAGGPIPVSNTEYVQSKCKNSLCTNIGPFTVECTTPAACSDGQICDLSTTNYGKCITQNGQDYCGDGICGLNENSNICSVDCKEEFNCKWYEESYEKDVKVWKWYNIATAGLIGPEVQPTRGCKTSGWVYMGGLGLFMLLVIIAIMYMPNKGVMAKKK